MPIKVKQVNNFKVGEWIEVGEFERKRCEILAFSCDLSFAGIGANAWSGRLATCKNKSMTCAADWLPFPPTNRPNSDYHR